MVATRKRASRAPIVRAMFASGALLLLIAACSSEDGASSSGMKCFKSADGARCRCWKSSSTPAPDATDVSVPSCDSSAFGGLAAACSYVEPCTCTPMGCVDQGDTCTCTKGAPPAGAIPSCSPASSDIHCCASLSYDRCTCSTKACDAILEEVVATCEASKLLGAELSTCDPPASSSSSSTSSSSSSSGGCHGCSSDSDCDRCQRCELSTCRCLTKVGCK